MNSAEFNIAGKNFLTAFILLFNALTWYFLTWTTMDNVLGVLGETGIHVVTIWTIYYTAIVGSAILGSILSKKLRIVRFLYLWMVLGTLSSLLLILLSNIETINVSIVGFSLGFSFGLGMPSCLAYFAESTYIENRGRTAGVIFLLINLGAPFFAISAGTFSLMTVSVISSVWRGFGLILFFLLKPPEQIIEMKKNFSFSSIFQNTPFILYLVAWLMFCSIDSFEKLILERFLQPDFYSSMQIMGAIIGSISALVGGWLCDFIGRKRVVMYGFVASGLAYAIIGIFQMTISWYFYFVVNSVAAGMLWVVFVLVLWGDLSQPSGREKYYAVGAIPYFLTPLIPVFLGPVVTFEPYTAFSLASFFLFVAVLPLLYAPETLPEKKIELRRLRKYVEKAKGIKEKHVEKTANS